MNNTYNAPKGRVITTIVIFAFVVFTIFTLFVWFQKLGYDREVKRLDTSISELQSQVDELKSQQVEELVFARNIVESVHGRAIPWSKVLKKLGDLTPVGVFYRTYSGGESGDVELTGLSDSYESTANVIKVMVDSEDFEDVFVPSVALGTTSDGQTVVSFGLQAKFVQQ